MRIKAAAFSSKGIREHNEDSYLLNTSIGGIGIEDTNSLYEYVKLPLFFAVADGMGGHAAGDVASQFVVSKVSEIINSGIFFNEEYLQIQLPVIHKQLLEKGLNDDTKNMGTTFVALSLGPDISGFCNIGDSRIYRLRNGFLQQLSHDDSLSEIIENAPKNIVTNALGAGLTDIFVETRFSNLMAIPGDTFLLCSDGVHWYISDDELENILNKTMQILEQAKEIVKTAINNQSDDNATAVIVKIEKE